MVVLARGAGASVPPLRTVFISTAATKKNAYHHQGVFTGGMAGTGTSLLTVRRSFAKKSALERVIIDLGDREAKPAGLKMGYFQAALDAKNNRLVLDVAQLRMSKVTEGQLQRLFKASPYVRTVSLTLDPQDGAATMVLDLKRPVRLEVFRSVKKGAPARIVMDLQPRTIR
jgi:hypothetical protein